MKTESYMTKQTNTQRLLAGLGSSQSMKTLSSILAVLWLLATVAYADTGNRISLLTGSLAGQAIGGTNCEINVAPGSTVSGTFDVLVHNAMPDAAIAPLAATPTWGVPQSNYWGITSWAPTGDSTQHVAVSLTVPSDEGLYYIVVAMAGTYNYAQLMSGTHPAYAADWVNGNKVALLSRCDLESAARNGWIPFNWYTPNGPSAGDMAMTVVRIVVRGPYLIKINLQTGTLAGQFIDSTHREIRVAPGAAIQGSFNVMVHNGLPGSAIAPVAATPTWGDPATSYWAVDPDIATGDNIRTVTTPANLVAPLTPGTYYIAVAMAGTYDYAQIMSGTHPAYSADWQHGNLVAHLPACDFETAARLGYVPFNWYPD